MIRFNKQNGLIIIELHYSQEKFEITRHIDGEYKNAILDLTHLNCSYPEMSKIVKSVLDECLQNGIQKTCIVTRPSLLSSIREYLRVVSGIDDVAFFNHISAANRYFTGYGDK